MYQISLSVSESKAEWFGEIAEVLSIRLKNHNGILATHSGGKRFVASVACENDNKGSVVSVLKESLTDMFGSVVKREYLEEKLRLPLLNKASYQLLLHTLVAFDRENEREIILSKLNWGSGNLALDGVFYFLLKELRSRWDEIAKMAMDNAMYLNDEETLNELIRFLISAVNPKIQTLEVCQRENRFKITGQADKSAFEYNITGTEQLMMYLIDVAPLEINLYGDFSDKVLYRRLVGIFDAKQVDHSFGKLQSQLID